MPRNYSVKETIRQIKEKNLNKEQKLINKSENIDDNFSIDNKTTKIDTEEYLERFDHKEESVIALITKRLKWW